MRIEIFQPWFDRLETGDGRTFALLTEDRYPVGPAMLVAGDKKMKINVMRTRSVEVSLLTNKDAADLGYQFREELLADLRRIKPSVRFQDHVLFFDFKRM